MSTRQKLMVILAAFSFAGAPILQADDAATSTAAVTDAAKPVQVLKSGRVDATLTEPEDFEWATGRGRKDAILEWAVEDNYAQKLPGMFLRGFSNLGFGWAEILTQPMSWSKNAPLGVGTLTGLIMGPTMAVLRMGSGALDIATCWVPLWHGVPMSKPVMGLHDVHNYGAIEDVDQYNKETRRYGFNKLSDEY